MLALERCLPHDHVNTLLCHLLWGLVLVHILDDLLHLVVHNTEVHLDGAGVHPNNPVSGGRPGVVAPSWTP